MITNAPIRNGGLSRLDCVKKTINAQIKEMCEKYPNRKVGLVTFSDDVEIFGDGHLPNTKVQPQLLNDYNFMVKNGVACAGT